MTLGERITSLRKLSGFSMNELARRAGMNAPTLQKIESGKSGDPSVSLIVRIALALNTNVESLVGAYVPDVALQTDLGTVVADVKVYRDGYFIDSRQAEIWLATAIGTLETDKVLEVHPSFEGQDVSEFRAFMFFEPTQRTSDAVETEQRLPEGPVANALRMMQGQMQAVYDLASQAAADAAEAKRLAAQASGAQTPEKTA